jgi:hypothetical protein
LEPTPTNGDPEVIVLSHTDVDNTHTFIHNLLNVLRQIANKMGLQKKNLVGMGMHWLGYNIGIIGKVGRNTYVVTVQVNYPAYVETNAPKYRVFCILSKKTYSITTLAT